MDIVTSGCCLSPDEYVFPPDSGEMYIKTSGCRLSPDGYVSSPETKKENLVILIPSEVILSHSPDVSFLSMFPLVFN